MGIAGSATATLIAGIVVVGRAAASTLYWRDLPIRLRGHELRYLIPEAALVQHDPRQGAADGRADAGHVDRAGSR